MATPASHTINSTHSHTVTTDNSGGGGEVTHPYCHPESATRPQHHLLDRFHVVCYQYRVKTTFPDSLSPSTQIFSFFLLIDMDVFMSMKACAWRQKIWKLGQSREVCDSLCNHAEYRHQSNQRCHMSVARLWAEGGDALNIQTHDTSLVSILR